MQALPFRDQFYRSFTVFYLASRFPLQSLVNRNPFRRKTRIPVYTDSLARHMGHRERNITPEVSARLCS